MRKPKPIEYRPILCELVQATINVGPSKPIGRVERLTADSAIVREPSGGTVELLFEHIRPCPAIYAHFAAGW